MLFIVSDKSEVGAARADSPSGGLGGTGAPSVLSAAR
jgi:hypothetical protein